MQGKRELKQSTPAPSPEDERIARLTAPLVDPHLIVDVRWHKADTISTSLMSAFGGKADILDGLADVRF
jgi:hypothetical protein